MWFHGSPGIGMHHVKKSLSHTWCLYLGRWPCHFEKDTHPMVMKGRGSYAGLLQEGTCSKVPHQEQGQQTRTSWSNPACCLFLQMSLYWNIATPFLSYIMSGCFHATMAELSSCNRDHNGCKTKIKIQYLVLYRMFADTWPWVFLVILACLVSPIRLQPA